MKVYFSHGKESGPWGTKIKVLAEIAKKHGCDVESIDYSDLMDPDLRVQRLLTVLENEDGEFILVGSSMGGYVSVIAAMQRVPKAMFLLAPALHMPGYDRETYSSDCDAIEVVHGWDDDIIPPDHSLRFAKAEDCTLHLISGDHRLNTSLDMVSRLFEHFLCRVK
jgi:alpha/beta superfamily hydrolase